MIETHDQHKPGNLANSAVLKMLEEEENERMYPGVNTERKSRSRQRQQPPSSSSSSSDHKKQIYIDRDTVLKINRRPPYHYRKRDFSWPPPSSTSSLQYNDDRSRSRSNSSEINFNDSICKKHKIDHIKEYFDKKALDEKYFNNNSPLNQKSKLNDYPEFDIKIYSDWPPKYNNSTSDNTLNRMDPFYHINKAYFMPENELHNIGIVEPKRKYFEKAASSSPDRRSYYYHNNNNNNNNNNLSDTNTTKLLLNSKRWKSNEYFASENAEGNENLQKGNIKYDYNKISSAELSNSFEDRELQKQQEQQQQRRNYFKSNSYSELPPMKPRRDNNLNLNKKSKLNLNNSREQEQEDASSKFILNEQNKNCFNNNEYKAKSQQENFIMDKRKSYNNDNNKENKRTNLTTTSSITVVVCKNCLLNIKQKTGIMLLPSSELQFKDNNNKNNHNLIFDYEKSVKFNLNDTLNKSKMNFHNKTDNMNSDVSFDSDINHHRHHHHHNHDSDIKQISDDNNKNKNKNNCNKDNYYQCCFHCGKITYDYNFVPQSYYIEALINYDLAADRIYDAKNICNHNFSTIKINENVNNTSNNNYTYDDDTSNTIATTNTDDDDIITSNNSENYYNRQHDDDEKIVIKENQKKQQNYNVNVIDYNNSMKNVLQRKQIDEILPEDEFKNKNRNSSKIVINATTTTTTEINKSIPKISMTEHRDKIDSDIDLQKTTSSKQIKSESIAQLESNKSTEKVYDDDKKLYNTTFQLIPSVTVDKANNNLSTTSNLTKNENYENDNQKNEILTKRDENFQDIFKKHENITFDNDVTRKQKNIQKDNTEIKYEQEIMGLSLEDKKKWRNGMYFTDGEYMWGPYEKWPFEGEPPTVLKQRFEENGNKSKQDAVKILLNNEKLNAENEVKNIKLLEMKEKLLPKSVKEDTNLIQTKKDNIEDDKESSLSTINTNQNNEDSKINEKRNQEIHNDEIENLKEINNYMKTTEQEIKDAENQLFESPSIADNIILFDTPLQTVIKDIFRKCLSPTPCPSSRKSSPIPPIPPIRQTISYISPTFRMGGTGSSSIVEYAPVVEHVLLDLYNISMAFDGLNNLTNITAVSTNNHDSQYFIPHLLENDYDDFNTNLHHQCNNKNNTAARIIELSDDVVYDNNNYENDNIGQNEVSLSETTSPHSSTMYEESLGSASGNEYHNTSSTITARDDGTITPTTTLSTITEASTTTTTSAINFDKVIQSKNILSGFLIAKQNQEEAFTKAGINLYSPLSSVVLNNNNNNNNNDIYMIKSESGILPNNTNEINIIYDEKGNTTLPMGDSIPFEKNFQFPIKMTINNNNNNNNSLNKIERNFEELKISDTINDNKFSQNDIISTSSNFINHCKNDSGNDGTPNIASVSDFDKNNYKTNWATNNNEKYQCQEMGHDEVIKSKTVSQLMVKNTSTITNNIQNDDVDNNDGSQQITKAKYAKLASRNSICYDNNNNNNNYNDDDNDVGENKSSDDTMNKDDKLIVNHQNKVKSSYDSASSYYLDSKNNKFNSYDNDKDVKHKHKHNNNNNNNNDTEVMVDTISNISKDIRLTCEHSNEGSQQEFKKIVAFNHYDDIDNKNRYLYSKQNEIEQQQYCNRLSRSQEKGHSSNNNNNNNNHKNMFRSISQPPPIERNNINNNSYCNDNNFPITDESSSSSYQLVRQHSFDSNENRYNDASPCLYLCGTFEPTKGYRKVAWPPVSDTIPVVKASTPQPQQHQQPYQQQYYQSPLPSQQQQQPQSYNQQSPVVSHNQPQQLSGQYYQPQSQPQYNQVDPQYYSQAHQLQQQQQLYRQPSAERGQSPGIITLRKEAPVSQKPSPVVQSQPAAASFQGGINMRGDLKWPPPEVKAQMVAENEERIKIAKSPPFRPRKVHRDYSQFFAKHALNSTYPGYKVPPGTQHVYVQY